MLVWITTASVNYFQFQSMEEVFATWLPTPLPLKTATPLEGTLGVKEALKIDLGFYDKIGGNWVKRAEHSVTNVLGEPLSLAFPSTSPETAGRNYDLVVLTGRGTAEAPAAQ